MTSTIETTITIQKTLFEQLEQVAQELEVSHDQLIETAIENMLVAYLHSQHFDSERVKINQGDVYWVQEESPIPHPYVVIQEDVLNQSRISTVIACPLTSNMKKANLPGNVLLDAYEANLSKQSVVEVSKVSTVNKAQLGDYVGSLTGRRIEQILDGMRFLQVSYFDC